MDAGALSYIDAVKRALTERRWVSWGYPAK
jgi:hypothetical protein